MPAVKGAKQTKEDIARLKEEYLEFYADCPKQALAAMFIMRDTDTITGWKKSDPVFSDMIKQAEARFARKNLLKTSADWKLARLMGEYFREPEQNINVKVTPILGGNSALPSDDGDQESTGAQETD
jgi:hypothetical protein